jgi:serine/threonine protein phosphatase PrpC
MNKEVRPAPVPKETQPKPEKLLSEATTGAQALVLLGLEPPKPDAPVLTVQKEQLQEQLLTHVREGIPADYKKRLTSASLHERQERWKDTPEDKRMETWRKDVNAFLDRCTKDKTKITEQKFLKTILKKDNLDDITADTVYSTFMQGEGQGDIEYFARRIVDTHTDNIEEIDIEEIEKNQELIKSLGKIYGDNSAKIGGLLTCAIANAKHNPDKFTTSAQENLNKRAYAEDVRTALAKNAAEWDGKQPEQSDGPFLTVPETAQPPQPEQLSQAEKLHPLVADAGEASESSYGKKANQDACFADKKHGAFGVFDGVGSDKKSTEVSHAVAAQIEQFLAKNDPQTLDETEELVRNAVTNTSKEMQRQEDARYAAVFEDIQKNAAGTFSDDKFDDKYLGPQRRNSVLPWIRRHFDRAKPDVINEYLKEWIKDQVRGSTTASVVKLWQGANGERKAIIANAGDSRVYHYTARDGKLRIVTIDDNLQYEAVGEDEARDIQEKKASGKREKDILGGKKVLLQQSNPQHRTVWDTQALNHDDFRTKYPWGDNGEVEVPLTEIDDYGLTKGIPNVNLEPNMQTIDVEPHDKLILTSDGVHEELLLTEMQNILNTSDNQEADKAARALVARAKKGELIPGAVSGQTKDDTTAVVVEIK